MYGAAQLIARRSRFSRNSAVRIQPSILKLRCTRRPTNNSRQDFYLLLSDGYVTDSFPREERGARNFARLVNRAPDGCGLDRQLALVRLIRTEPI